MKHRISRLLSVTALVAAFGLTGPAAHAQTAGLSREYYANIPGNDVVALTSAPDFPDRPTFRDVLTTAFETPQNLGDNYGQRIRGFLSAPQTGDYVFWIASDDQSVLFLSPNEDPAMKREIASVSGATSFRNWFNEPGQQSAPVRLEAGRLYYIEALTKEGGGSDHFSTRWALPLGGVEEPIPAVNFLPAGTPLFPPQLTRQPASLGVVEGGSASFRVEVSNTDPITFQWQRDNVPIAGATGATLVLPRVGLGDDGARYRCTLINPIGFVLSDEAVLSVLPDRTPPGLDQVFNTTITNVLVRFTEPVGTNSAWRIGNYSIDGGVGVLAAGPGSEASTVLLTTTPMTVGSVHTLAVSGVVDLAATPNAVPAGSQATFTVLGFAPVDIGRPPAPGRVEPVPGGLDITVVGAGVGGTNDQFHFSRQQRIGDFDVEVRIESLELGNLFAQAGLMARQSPDADSPFAAVLATPSLAGSFFSWRGQTGAVARIQGSAPVNYPRTWLRLKRQGTNFTGFASLDGVAWTRLGSAGIALSNSVHLGLVAGSRATNATVVAAFRDFTDHADRATEGFLPDAVEPLGPSSRRTGLVLSEIMYHPETRADGKRLEFVEVFNSDSVFADLGGFRLSGDIEYTFPEGTVLEAGGFLVVAQAPADLGGTAVEGGARVLGPWSGALPREGGTVRLRNRTGAVFLEVTYADAAPWPVAADGAGHSMVLARPSYGEGDPRAWSASEKRGGSPGRAEVRLPEPRRHVRVNEVLAHTDDPVLDFVELHNAGPTEVDLGGCVLTDDPGRARFVIPEGTKVAPGGKVAWDQAQLGFALSSAGEVVLLMNPGRDRVLDAVRFGPQLNGVSSGRVPDGGERWTLLASPSPGNPNGPARFESIVINEIFYHGPGDGREEFVELFNRGAAPVDLRGWRFVDGIDFAFTDSVVLQPGAHLAIAADAAHLRTLHPGLGIDRVVGDFGGNLSNGGERIALARPETLTSTNSAGALVSTTVFVTVAEVTYHDGGRWGRWSDGDGSSLELLDPRAADGLAPQWGDSDETAKSVWTTVEFTGRLELGQGDPDELQVMLLGAGECLIDNIEVRDAGGASLVLNGTFEGGMDGWIAQGNHVASGLADRGFESGRSLHLRASAGGDNGANRIKTVLNGGALREGATATLRARVRWLRGHPDLLLRLKGNYLETVAHMPVPTDLGTPGAVNSRRLANAGPAIVDVAHFPVVPAATEAVRVTARVHDPDGLRSFRLKYRFDPSVTVNQVDLRDNGMEGDLVAGDGVHSAIIPGQAAGVLVAFWIEAVDGGLTAATTTFPADPALGECLVRFGEQIPSGSFGTYRLWMTQRRTDVWTEREFMSNEALDGTVVYGTHRAIYNAGARYRGSPFIRPGYTGPTGSLCAYVWTLPSDDRLLGSDEFNLDWLEQPGRDPTLQRERISFWIGQQLGVPFSHQRYVRILVNGVQRGEVYADTQQPNRDYVEGWFPDAPEGEIFKIDDWFEFNDAVQREFNEDARLERYVSGDGTLHRTRYRWNWEKKANGGLDDDYSRFLELVEALNLPDEAEYTQRVSEVVDLDGWLRTIATRRVVADWDGYGYSRGKNTFAYLPPDGRWSLLLWDLDFSLGGGSDGASTTVYTANDPVMERMYRNPLFGRVYLQAFSDAIRGPLAPGVADALMDANFTAFLGNQVQAQSPAPIGSWITARRSFLARVLATNSAPWSVGVSGGGVMTTDESVVRLSGTSPIDVRWIAVNGFAYEPSWSSTTNWSLAIPLRAGTNSLVLGGIDRRGAPVVGSLSTVSVVYTGVDERPEDFVRITEIMYEPVDPDAEFVEVHNASTRTTYDLSGWGLQGVDLVVPGGLALAPGEYAVFVKDRAVFQRAYGDRARVLAEFPGRLNNAGETLRLVRPGPTSEPWLPVDEVTYSNRSPWPIRATGQGGALQVVDAAQDNRRPSNWGAVDAMGYGHSGWRFVAVTDRAGSSTLVLSLGGAGQVHVDDVSLVSGPVPRTGPERVVNGGFEEPLAPSWVAGPAAASVIDPAIRRSGRSSLKLVGSAGGSAPDSALTQTLATPVVPGEIYTLSFWYLADPEGTDLILRTEGGGLYTLVDARESSVAPATPGAASSVAAPLAPFPDLWINEVLPRGIGGSGVPWIELHNAGRTSVNLAGWSLSPDPGWPGAWAFPAGAAIGAGEFLVVWADGGSGLAADGWHAGFTLPASTGSVVLSRTAGGVPSVVDVLHYEGLSNGRSMGSFPDGAWSERHVFEVPTPGAPNDRFSPVVRLVINEWMTRNNTTVADPADGDFDDWFELYNAGDTAVDLGGYTLTDDPSEPRKSAIPAGFVLAPRSVMLVWADGEPDQNGPGREFHADFALSADGETIALYSPGGNLVDLVRFGPLGRDVSEGLVPDGVVGSVMRLPVPSPRERNAASPGGEIRLTGLDVAGGSTLLTWSTVAGHVYEVEATDVLGAPWVSMSGEVVATGPSTQWLDATGGGAARFYRVVRRGP
ncbi:MAG: lamin tail domain-containing protein [Limisphaerales bacterium]